MRQLKLFDEPSELPKIDYSWRYYFSTWWRYISGKQKEVKPSCHCGRRDDLDVHHRDPRPRYQRRGRERIDVDITTMCHSCHMKHHEALELLAEHDRRRRGAA